MSNAAPDPHAAAAIARAERRRGMLERLAEVGMHLAEQVGAHAAAAMSAVNEDHGGDPARAFATAARAVRLTLAMEARVDRQILALRKGEGLGSTRSSGSRPDVEAAPRARSNGACERRQDQALAREAREGLHESDWEDLGDRREVHLGAVAARAGLGFAPDGRLGLEAAITAELEEASPAPEASGLRLNGWANPHPRE